MAETNQPDQQRSEQPRRKFRNLRAPRPFGRLKNFVRRSPSIQEVVRETTAGGVIYRKNPDTKELEFLMVRDAKDRWTVPKGHVEEGETTRETALRETGEETGLTNVKVQDFLGKTNFRYRREQSLVLMVTHIFLIKCLDPYQKLVAEDWMNDIRWFPAHDAVKDVAYEDIAKMMLISIKKLKERKF